MSNRFRTCCKGSGFVETHPGSGIYMFCPTCALVEAEQFGATTVEERQRAEEPAKYVNDVERLRDQGWSPEPATPAHHEDAWDFKVCLTWPDVIALSGCLLALLLLVGLAIAKVLHQVCT